MRRIKFFTLISVLAILFASCENTRECYCHLTKVPLYSDYIQETSVSVETEKSCNELESDYSEREFQAFLSNAVAFDIQCIEL